MLAPTMNSESYLLSNSDSLMTAVESLSISSSSTLTAIETDSFIFKIPHHLALRHRRCKSKYYRSFHISGMSFSPPINFSVVPQVNFQNSSTITGTSNLCRRQNRRPYRHGKIPLKKGFSLTFHKEKSQIETVYFLPEEQNMMKSFPKPTNDISTQLVNNDGKYIYPLLYLSPAGSICIVLSPELIVETAVDGSVRVVSHGKFSTFVDGRGVTSSIVHPNVRLLFANKSVCGRFSASNDKLVVIGNNSILFTMEHLREAYLVSSAIKGTSAVSLEKQRFPKLSKDYALLQFYKNSQIGPEFIPMCQEIIDTTIYDRRPNGTLVMQINGMIIRHSNYGLIVDARPRHIFCSADGTIHVRSSQISMSVQNSITASIKYGTKRVHVSVSGMVVSDGSNCTSMDQWGRILSCS